MKIAIIGAGFTGLAAAWDLIRAGHQVTIFEASDRPGGLAAGFQQPSWAWSLEYHYHHIFATDQALKQLLQEMQLTELMFFERVRTASLYQGQVAQLDSPLSLLRFPYLSWGAKLRTAAVLAFLKLNPAGQLLERWTAQEFLQATMGQKAYQVLWQPLFQGKFGSEAQQINMAWFWARIYARSASLGYFKGGFLNLAQQITTKLKQQGVKFQLNSKINHLEHHNKQLIVSDQGFDRVLLTVTSKIYAQLTQGLIKQSSQLQKLQGLAAMTLVLALDQPFFQDQTYWLNINEPDWPFLAVVEHTNLVDSQHYDGNNLVYVGKYLPANDQFFKLNKIQVLKKYQPFLNQLAPQFKNQLKQSWLFKANFAQPITKVNHSKLVPSIKTDHPQVYWASMQQIYPWDRGVNYAVQLGRKAAVEITD
ncbi:MAG: FAD-dependent oxidoreductase [Candidatus Pacebacteria bacterium]|nr:FAD-dependent oxidoreductase [Candidatus Paceibacterota bacterium]